MEGGISPNPVDRCPVQEGLYVFRGRVHDALPASAGSPGNVRGNQTVLGFQKRIVRMDGFCGHYIQAGGIQMPAV